MSLVRRAMGPRVERWCQSGAWGPPLGTRPSDGLKPDRPHNAEGMRIDPPPSDPVAKGTMPAAMAAALPPEEPPGVRVVSHGLRVVPKTALSVCGFQPNSGVLVLPTMTAPAARRRATSTESSAADGSSRYATDPWLVGRPAASSRSLTPIGTPA